MMDFKITHFNCDLMGLEMILNFERFSILNFERFSILKKNNEHNLCA